EQKIALQEITNELGLADETFYFPERATDMLLYSSLKSPSLIGNKAVALRKIRKSYGREADRPAFSRTTLSNTASTAEKERSVLCHKLPLVAFFLCWLSHLSISHWPCVNC